MLIYMTRTTFDDFLAEIEAEAQAEGPEAVAELEAFRLHFSLARQRAAQRRAQHLTQRQLAERSGIGQARSSRIERGELHYRDARRIDRRAQA